MFRFHALGGVSVLALLLAPATIANANHDLPPVTVDAPAPAKRAVRKPAPRPTSSARRSHTAATAPQRQIPVVVANAEGSGPAVPGTPPIKQR
jgi:iron complex outermembrane receptor protein